MKDWASPVGKPRKHVCTWGKLILAGPVKVTTYRKVSLFPTTMATRWRIVTLIHDAQTKVVMSEKDDTRHVVVNGCII